MESARNPFVDLRPLIESRAMTPRDLAVYGMLAAIVGEGRAPTLQDVGSIIGTREDRHKAARRALRKLERLGLVSREHTIGAPMAIRVHLPSIAG